MPGTSCSITSFWALGGPPRRQAGPGLPPYSVGGEAEAQGPVRSPTLWGVFVSDYKSVTSHKQGGGKKMSKESNEEHLWSQHTPVLTRWGVLEGHLAWE